MIDTSMIALDDLIEQETPTRLGKASGNGTKRTRKGACPWCGGDDRFGVLVNDDPPHYYCGMHGGAGCGKHGDAIKFIQEWRNVSFVEAVKYLQNKGYDIELPERGDTSAPRKKREPKFEVNVDAPPNDTWAMQALSFARQCQKVLWSEKGRPAREWLHARGFTDETIRDRQYGYNPGNLNRQSASESPDRFDDIADWGVNEGKKVWLPRGIVIPYMLDGVIWKLNIRRGDSDLKREQQKGEKPRKYVAVKGGSNAIYRVDTIQPHQPLIMFEGEFNADLLHQQLNAAGVTNIAVIATGSTGKGRADNWLLKITKASPVLISFDPDNGGDKATREYWLQVLPQATQWKTVGGDLNDMLLAGVDVVKWLNRGLKCVGSASIVPTPISPRVEQCHTSVEQVEEKWTPATSGTIAYYHSCHEKPYMDEDGVTREYVVTFLSYEADPDICYSPYFEQIMHEVWAFEQDAGLQQFELWDTAKNILVAKFRKWRVEEDAEPTAPPATFTLPAPIQHFDYPHDKHGAIDWRRLASIMPPLLHHSEVPDSFKHQPCARCKNVGKVCRRCDGLVVCSCFWWWQATPGQAPLTLVDNIAA